MEVLTTILKVLGKKRKDKRSKDLVADSVQQRNKRGNDGKWERSMGKWKRSSKGERVIQEKEVRIKGVSRRNKLR